MKNWTIRGTVLVLVLIGLAVARSLWPTRVDAWVIILCMLATVAAIYPDLLKFIGGKIRKLSGPWGELDLSGNPEMEEAMKELRDRFPDFRKIPSPDGLQDFKGLRTKTILLEGDDGQFLGFIGQVGKELVMQLGAKGMPGLSFNNHTDGSAALSLFDASGATRIGLGLTPPGKLLPAGQPFVMLGKDDKVGAMISAPEHGQPSVDLFDESGKIRRSLTIPPSAVDAVTKKRKGTTLLTRPDVDSDEVNP